MNERNNTKWLQLLDPAFLVCVAVLLAATGGLAITGRSMVQKEPLFLKKPLGDLDEKMLEPYRVVEKSRITNADELRSLGAQEYIQWRLEDTSVEPGSPVRFVFLLVTYYTGKTLDAVVHTPEACYLGGGNQARGASNEDFAIDGPADEGQTGKQVDVPVRCAVFARGGNNVWESTAPFTVMYTFKVNGTYQRDRTATRTRLNLNLGKYAYYAKVEWQLFGASSISGGMLYPPKEDAVEASKKFLSVVLGELERSHWPDWEEAMARSDETQSAGNGD